MEPKVTETKYDFMTRCLGDTLTSKQASECELIWNSFLERIEETKPLKLETQKHIWDVEMLLHNEIDVLTTRAQSHDHTKLTFEALELLKSCLDGVGDWDEWKAYHFSKEDHHPEYWENKTDMPLAAVMEMVADGAAAQYARGYLKTGVLTTFEEQKQFYMEHKGWGEEMATLLANQFMRYFNQLVEADPYNVGDPNV